MIPDLCVVGGGSGGFGAALAAARAGLSVVLVEKSGTLGGNAVRSGVSCWEPGAGGTGLPFELYRRLRHIPNAIGIYSFGRHCCWPNSGGFPGGQMVIDPTRRYADTLRRHGSLGMATDEAFCRAHWHGVPFEPDAMAVVMRQMLAETGRCRLVLNSAFATVCARDGAIASITLANGETIAALMFVDGTADALLCLAAGCSAMVGQESRDRFGEPSAPAQPTPRVNGVSLIYRITPADPPGREAVAVACWWCPQYPVTSMFHFPNGDRCLNMLPTMEGEEFLRLGYAAAYEECRRRVLAHWHDLQARFEEFRHYRLQAIAPGLGVRETRRIRGEYVLTEIDLRAGIRNQKQDDLIAIADHALDTHGMARHDCGELAEPYGIPFRCLIPQGWRNLLVACRGASFSSLAASSCRLSRTMMQLGQAAGTAVALARRLEVSLPAVPPGQLRSALRAEHAQVDWPMPPELVEYLAANDG